MKKSIGSILILSSLLIAGCGNNDSGTDTSSSLEEVCDKKIPAADSELLSKCKNSGASLEKARTCSDITVDKDQFVECIDSGLDHRLGLF